MRSVDGDPGRVHNEIYRFALYYRDRIAESAERAVVSSALVYGPIDGGQVVEAISEALGAEPQLFNPVPGALAPGAEAEIGPAVLAGAGIATQAWSN